MNIRNEVKVEKKTAALFFGPAVFAASLLLPEGLFTFNESAAIGTVFWMACWWITRPVHIAVTAMLPVIINAIFNLVPMSGVVSKYSSEIVVLLLGANLLSITWSETGLDKRISLKALCMIGPTLKQQIAVWFIISAILSIFLPNTVVCAVLTPIAVSMLAFNGETDIGTSSVATIILLAIAWGSGIGGCGSPLGGAMNLVAIDYIEKLTGTEYMYVDWVILLVPMLIILIAVNIAYLWSVKTEVKELNGTKDYFTGLYRALPRMNRGESISLILFILASLLAFCRPLYAEIFPAVKPAYVFLIFGVMSFVLKDERGKAILEWPRAQKEIMWDMLLLFAGGLAVGKLITDTGAAGAIADLISKSNLTGGLATVAVFVIFTCMLAEVSSNTAAAAIAVPVVISITQKLGLDPIPYIYITAAAFNSAYVLPISIRAIPVGYGLDPQSLVKHGIRLAVLSMATITVTGFLYLRFLG